MITRRLVVATSAAVAVAAGGAAAVAATVKDDRKAAETEVLADAAKRLNVQPSELKDALAKAQDAQIDQAVKEGKLTQAQADEIKKRRAERGTVLGLGGRGGPHGGRGGRGFGGGPGHGFGGRAALIGLADAAAKELGLTRAKLIEQLRSGKTLTEIAKAQKKDLADVKSATRASLAKTLAAKVADSSITDAQRDHVLEEFDEHFDEVATRAGGRGFFKKGRGGRHGFPHPGTGGPGGPGKGGPNSAPTPQATPGSYPGEVAPGTDPA